MTNLALARFILEKLAPYISDYIGYYDRINDKYRIIFWATDDSETVELIFNSNGSFESVVE